MTTPSDALAQLFRDTAKAHRAAFETTDGHDPEWPMWYAEQLKPSFDRLLTNPPLTHSEIIALLVELDQEHRTREPDQPWDEVYARHVAERHISAPGERLALYVLDYCVFCIRVIKVIEQLGISVEFRDIWDKPEHRKELMEARGRPTVPVLRCESPDGEIRWMPESADIIRYLKQRFS